MSGENAVVSNIQRYFIDSTAPYCYNFNYRCISPTVLFRRSHHND